MYKVIDNMSPHKAIVYPRTVKKLQLMGEQIKLARLRRRLTASLVAERAGISRMTLYKLEKGSPSVSIGTLAAVLCALGGMDVDMELIARDDVAGRTYQDLELLTPKRGRSKRHN